MLTWPRAAELACLGVDEMRPQLDLANRLSSATAYRRTGRVLFDGLDYQLAKEGLAVMDELARAIPQPLASAAADWSEIETQRRADELAAQLQEGAA